MPRYRWAVIVWLTVLIAALLLLGCDEPDPNQPRGGRWKKIENPPDAPEGLVCRVWDDEHSTILNGVFCYYPRPEESACGR